MSALEGRRQRSLLIGVVGIGIGLVALIVFSVMGIQIAKNSTEGQAAPLGIAYKGGFPYTPTGLIGVVDDGGNLVSLAILTVDQSGVGGTIVVAAPMADAASGTGDMLEPLDRVYTVEGVQVFVDQAELMTRLSFDVIEIMTPSRFEALISPLSKVTIDLPITVHDSKTQKEWSSGKTQGDPKEATAILTAHDPEIDDYYYLPARSAVWAGIANSIGDGVSVSPGLVAGQPVTTPKSMDELWQRVMSGPVEARSLVVQRVPAELVKERLDPVLMEPGVSSSVVVHDRAEMISIFASIAPGRIGAPNAAARLRIVSSFTPEEVAAVGAGWDAAAMWKYIIDGLLFGDTNVVSIDATSRTPVPEVTQVQVVDGYISDADRDILTVIFGDFEAVPTADPIQGVNATVVLGRSFLTHLAKSKVPTFAIAVESATGDTPSTASTDGEPVIIIDSSQDSTIADSSATASSGTG